MEVLSALVFLRVTLNSVSFKTRKSRGKFKFHPMLGDIFSLLFFGITGWHEFGNGTFRESIYVYKILFAVDLVNRLELVN